MTNANNFVCWSSFRLWKDFVSFVNNTIVEGSLENVEALPPDRFAPLKFPSTKMDIYLNSLPYTGCRESDRIYPPGETLNIDNLGSYVPKCEEIVSQTVKDILNTKE